MKRAYVSLISHGDGYLPGLEALGRSLVASGSDVTRLAMATADVPDAARARLRAGGWIVRRVEPIHSPQPTPLFPRFRDVFTKLRAWEHDDFDKLVYLDADTLVLQNVDDLFERPALSAAPDFLLPDHFNSGVMVLEPSRSELERMLAALEQSESYDGGDQGFLNEYFGWYALPPEHRLPTGYNTHHFIYQFLRSHPILHKELSRVRIVHYTVQKPWANRPLPLLTGGADVWWQTWFDAHPGEDRRWKRRMRALQDWSFDRVLERIVK